MASLIAYIINKERESEPTLSGTTVFSFRTGTSWVSFLSNFVIIGGLS